MPVRDFLSDATGDLAVVNGDFALVADAAAVVQAIDVHLQTFLGEIWMDESLGVPWHQQILGKGATPLLVKSLLTREIAKVPDVLDVLAVSYSGPDENRRVTIGYTVRTTYSTSPVQGVVEVPG